MNRTISDFAMTKCKINPIDLQTLAVGLGNCSTINVLNLSENEFQGFELIKPLKTIIQKHAERKNEIVWAASLRGEVPAEDPNTKGRDLSREKLRGFKWGK